MKDNHEHSAPDYYGRCKGCGERIESPSRWMQDEAKRQGGTVVRFTKKITIPAGVRPEDFAAHFRAKAEVAVRELSRKVLTQLHGKSDARRDTSTQP